ncbi:MAG: hypothetical protein K2H98_07335 [Duncaniella sp.]|nr:hypothetical protein [Duncaniella sp.]
MNSPIMCPAEIVADPSDTSKCEVKLSAAFCQFTWFICDIVLKLADRAVLQEGADMRNGGLNQFIKDSLKELKKSGNHPEVGKYYDCVEMFGRPIFKTRLLEEVDLCSRLLSQKTKRLAMMPFQRFKPHGKYEQRVNSTYLYAIALVLLHERGHYDLGHMNTWEQKIEQESDADQSAIWISLLSDAKDRRFSMNCGILLGFFATLMHGANIPDDPANPHPDAHQRLTDFYNIVKAENPKYTVLYNLMNEIWKSYSGKVAVGEDSTAEFKETFSAMI